MRNALIVTHQFLDESDLAENNSWKLKVFKYTLNKYRDLNPKEYIILVGHGKPIPNSIRELADWCYWHDGLIPNEINWGHPVCVNIAIQHCEEKGISFITKTRLDTINIIKDINSFCFSKIGNESDKFIITWFDHNYYSIMDLFFSGALESLKNLYEYSSWERFWPDFTQQGGTFPLAYNFYKNILKIKIPNKFNQRKWLQDIESKIIIMSPSELKWVDLRQFNFLVEESSGKLLVDEHSNLLSNFFWRH